MKKWFTIGLAIVLICTLSMVSLSAYGADEKLDANDQQTQQMLTNARFENMLNNNYVYGDAFGSISAIIDGSVISLISKINDGKIENTELIAFARNMYGVDLTVLSDQGKDVLQEEKTTSVLPRGYTKYIHTVNFINENADGTITVYSTVNAETHDGENIQKEAISRFVKNENSSFGYNLLSCELLVIEENIVAFAAM